MTASLLRNAGIWLLALALWSLSAGDVQAAPTGPADDLFPMLADYARAIREKSPRTDGIRHIDTPALIRQLKKLHVDTYFFLIWEQPTDWDDLRNEFLPAARKEGIRVFAYLVPPSESRSKRSEPFGTDYAKWFRAIGHLSKKFPNLKGVVMDDFTDNLDTFTPDRLKRIRAAGKAENPNLLFFPQVYYPAVTPAFVRAYAPLIDGLVLAFRDDRQRNTQRLDRLTEQTDQVQYELEAHRIPLILMIYASRLSLTPANPSARYIEQAVKLATVRLRLGRLQGIVTYVLPKEPHQETKERIQAASGNSYASLFAPPQAVGGRRDMVEWVQPIRLEHPPPYRLTFRLFRVSPSGLPPGAFALQILADRNVVWNQELSRIEPYVWHVRTADLTRALSGKKHAVLSLRLIRLIPGRFWSYVGLDDLKPEGFSLKNPDFELGGLGWTAVAGSRGMLGDIIFQDPSRGTRAFMTVRKHYGAFSLFRSVSDRAAQPVLPRLADRLLNRILLNRTDEALDLLEQMVPLILFDQGLSLEEKERLIHLSHDLHLQLDHERD